MVPNATMTAIMGRMATYTGKEITWEQALNSKHVLVPSDLSWSSNPPTLPNEKRKIFNSKTWSHENQLN